ncbi:MAG: hypothetical protein ACKO8I_02405, partial [Cyanobacteriota bacterium]
MSTEVRAAGENATSERRLRQGFEEAGVARGFSPPEISRDQQAGIELVSNQLAKNAHYEDIRRGLAQAVVSHIDHAKIIPIRSLSPEVLSVVNWDRIQSLEAGISAVNAISSRLQAEWAEQNRSRFAELLKPSHGMVEALGMQVSRGAAETLGLHARRFDRSDVEAIAKWARRSLEGFPTLATHKEIGLERHAMGALGSVGKLADLEKRFRIHVAPHPPSQSAPRPGRCREAFLDGAPFSPVREAPSHPEPTDWLEDGLDDEVCRKFLEQLNRFVRSEEIPSDVREGMDFLLALWKLKKTGISKAERHKLHMTVVDFLRQQIGVTSPASGLHLLRVNPLGRFASIK